MKFLLSIFFLVAPSIYNASADLNSNQEDEQQNISDDDYNEDDEEITDEAQDVVQDFSPNKSMKTTQALNLDIDTTEVQEEEGSDEPLSSSLSPEELKKFNAYLGRDDVSFAEEEPSDEDNN